MGLPKHRDVRHRTERLGPILAAASSAVVAATSMLLGLLQLVLLLRLGTGRPTDAYFYVLAWSVVPIQLVLVSFYYPLLLRRGDLNDRVGNRVSLVAAVGTVGASSVAACLYWQIAGSFNGLALQSIVGTLGTLISVRVWVLALRHAANGAPGWLAGVNLFPSLFAIACLLTLGSQSSVNGNVAWMLFGQGLGFAAYLGLMRVVGDARPHQTAS